MKNIMVPTDFSSNAKKAFHYAINIAHSTGAKIYLIHAFALLESTFIDRKSLREAWNEEQEQKKRAMLLQLAEEGRELKPNVLIEELLFTGATEAVLIRYAKENNIDLIVMGTQGASGLAAVLVGSVAAAIISGSNAPVLAIPKGYQGEEPHSIVLAVDELNQDTDTLSIAANLAKDFNIALKTVMFLNENESESIRIAKKEGLERYTENLRLAFPATQIESEIILGEDFENDIQDYCNRKGIGILCMVTYKRGFWERIFRPSATRRMAFHTTLPLLAIAGQD